MCFRGRPSLFPRSFTFGNTQNVRAQAISSNFDRRFRVVGGCRKSRISPDHNRNCCDREWMPSSIQVLSEEFFLRCESLSWAAFEIGSRLSELEAKAFSGSGLTSIHLPASVTVIVSPVFVVAAHLCRSHLNPAHNYLNLQTGHFVGVA
jgi:hypothetical protein